MLWGYFKKMVIADRLAAATDALLKAQSLPGWFILGSVILYAVRLYTDFSGGMDAIRGVSRMLGIELPENFRRPFFSQSVAEYWRRWHIILGAWFRSYLLYPLTTSKAGIALGKAASKALGKKTGRMVPSALATLLVFLLIGIWHTANWNAVIFGAYFGLVMAASMLLEPLWKQMRTALKLPKNGWMAPFRLLRTWVLILLVLLYGRTGRKTNQGRAERTAGPVYAAGSVCTAGGNAPHRHHEAGQKSAETIDAVKHENLSICRCFLYGFCYFANTFVLCSPSVYCPMGISWYNNKRG